MLSGWLSRSADGRAGRRTSGASRRGREPFAVRARRWGSWLAWLLVVAGLAGGAGVATYRARAFLYRSAFFKIRSVRLYGLTDELDREVSRQARLEGLEGRNLFLLNASSVERRIHEHPKIAEAKVVKCFPDSLWITARERKPAACVNSGEIFYVDAEGVLLEKAGAASAPKDDLPFISGLKISGLGPGDRIESEGLRRALDLLGRLRKMTPKLYGMVSEIHVGEMEGLTLYLRGGLEVRLGHLDPVERMPALEKFLETRASLDDLTYVDLRFDRQIVYY